MSSDVTTDHRARTAPADAETAGEPRGSRTAGSAVRAWLFLVWFCLQRQARARQMVWIALALLGFTVSLVAVNTAADRWGMGHWRWRWREPAPNGLATGKDQDGRRVVQRYDQALVNLQLLSITAPWQAPALAVQNAVTATSRTALGRSDFYVFSNWVVFSIFLSFLLPIWSLSFATEALGSEREGGSLVWLLTRPLPRASVYLAKFVALLPWGLGLNLGGFALVCVAAGQPGYRAFELYWPAIFWASLAFCSLFHLLGASFRRAAVVALIYSFFLETILGNMPGLMKRISLGFYTRCMMFDVAQEYGVQPVKPSVYLPVSGDVACLVLAGATLAFLGIGMVVFARSQYQDLT